MTDAVVSPSSYHTSLYFSYSGILEAIERTAIVKRLNAISDLRHLNNRLLYGQLKSHEVENFISTGKGKSIAANPDVRDALLLLHGICLVMEKDWPMAIERLKPLANARRNDVKLAAMSIETLAFERQGGGISEVEGRLDAISELYGMKLVKNLLLTMTLSNIDDGIRAVAAGKESLVFAHRVAMLDKIGKEHGEDIVEPAFRIGKAWLEENIDAVWDGFVTPRRLNFKTKQLLTNGMKLSIRKLISETGGKASIYIDEFENNTMNTIQTQSLGFANGQIEDAERDDAIEWDFCFSPPPIETYRIKVKLNNIGEPPPRIHVDQDCYCFV